mmetsp:Transcript_74486/g.227925  ORF Transcript_74486/g.227925 Transcript_74486/m.227925 type:complete len:280 (-) Transcript_74486:3246-4085(-)
MDRDRSAVRRVLHLAAAPLDRLPLARPPQLHPHPGARSQFCFFVRRLVLGLLEQGFCAEARPVRADGLGPVRGPPLHPQDAAEGPRPIIGLLGGPRDRVHIDEPAPLPDLHPRKQRHPEVQGGKATARRHRQCHLGPHAWQLHRRRGVLHLPVGPGHGLEQPVRVSVRCQSVRSASNHGQVLRGGQEVHVRLRQLRLQRRVRPAARVPDMHGRHLLRVLRLLGDRRQHHGPKAFLERPEEHQRAHRPPARGGPRGAPVRGGLRARVAARVVRHDQAPPR